MLGFYAELAPKLLICNSLRNLMRLWQKVLIMKPSAKRKVYVQKNGILNTVDDDFGYASGSDSDSGHYSDEGECDVSNAGSGSFSDEDSDDDMS